MSDRPGITNELRAAFSYETATDSMARTSASIDAGKLMDLCDIIDSVHSALEVECERLREQDHNGWIRLPEADDGMPIHVGDVLQHGPQGLKFKVEELIFNGDDWFVSFGIGPSVFNVTAYSHYQPDTWEKIIEDALGSRYSASDELSDDFVNLVARCKALAGDAE